MQKIKAKHFKKAFLIVLYSAILVSTVVGMSAGAFMGS